MIIKNSNFFLTLNFVYIYFCFDGLMLKLFLKIKKNYFNVIFNKITIITFSKIPLKYYANLASLKKMNLVPQNIWNSKLFWHDIECLKESMFKSLIRELNLEKKESDNSAIICKSQFAYKSKMIASPFLQDEGELRTQIQNAVR